jgi:hypothetical protein
MEPVMAKTPHPISGVARTPYQALFQFWKASKPPGEAAGATIRTSVQREPLWANETLFEPSAEEYVLSSSQTEQTRLLLGRYRFHLGCFNASHRC